VGDILIYKEYLHQKMLELSKDPKVIFLGYNVRYGHKFNGNLIKVPEKQLLEMPVAENLIMGVGIGMALEGYRPIVCIERMDFLWACADQLINHLDKAKQLGWPPLDLIIRTCVADTKPLNAGCQHTGDYFNIFRQLLKEVKVLTFWPEELVGPAMIIEWRKDYAKDYITS
jgi:pyruvate/2-oxoglutarate/acetoin dehydrogenase E1 component